MRTSSHTLRRGLVAGLCALLLLIAGGAWAADRPPQAAIAGAHPLATDAGFEVLAAGGNASSMRRWRSAPPWRS